MLNDEKVFAIIKEYLEGRFPKRCSCCGRVFSTMEEYLRQTIQVGDPISINASLEAGQPKARVGTIACANCSCGTTLSVSSSGIDPAIMREIASWAQAESSRRGTTVGQLLVEIRRAIDQSVLHEDDDDESASGAPH